MTDPTAAEVVASLLPCPFCGGKGITHMDSDRDWFVFCDGCDLEMPRVNRTKAEAIAAWNTRSTPAADAGEVREKVAEALWNVGNRERYCMSWERAKAENHNWVDGCYQHADAVVALLSPADIAQVAPGVRDWQPIETAPKDGTDIVVSCGPDFDPMYAVAHWKDGGWEMWWKPDAYATWASHWIPLPSPSQAVGEG